MPFTKKFDANMVDRLHMRLNAEQKTRLQLVARDTAGTSDFWREAILIMADTILQVERGNLSPEELEKELGERLTGFVVSSGVLKAGKEDVKEPG